MRAWLALAPVLLLTSACSAIVGTPPGVLHCDPASVGACPADLSCLCVPDGDCTCEPCVAVPEQCNGLDEDCDGVADNGLGMDRDRDGVPGCRDGMAGDCDDGNPLVFPGNPETCNGYDDDCDLRTVETGSCPAGLLCGPPSDGSAVRCVDPGDCNDIACDPGEVCRDGRCTVDAPDDCNTMPSLCTAGQVCDRGSGTCVDVGLDGSSCQLDSECQSGRCYLADSLGLLESARICSRACCTDANCAPDQYCAASGSGARGCVTGPRTPPTSCGRSGDCGGSECRLASSYTFECESAGGRNGGAPCDDSAQCASGLCGADAYCLDACGAVTDCPSPPFWSNGESACRYTGFRVGEIVNWVTVCEYAVAFVGDIPDGRQGSGCSSDDGCRDGFCNPVSRTCADACCNDSQCPADQMCAPIDHGGWEMRCLPRRGT